MRIVDLGTFDYLTKPEPVLPGSRAERIVAQTRCHDCSWHTEWCPCGREVVAAAIRHTAHAHAPHRRTA